MAVVRCCTAKCAVSPSTGFALNQQSAPLRRTKKIGAADAASSVMCAARRTSWLRYRRVISFFFFPFHKCCLVFWPHTFCLPCIPQPLLECERCQNCYHASCLGPNYPKLNKKRKAWVRLHQCADVLGSGLALLLMVSFSAGLYAMHQVQKLRCHARQELGDWLEPRQRPLSRLFKTLRAGWGKDSQRPTISFFLAHYLHLNIIFTLFRELLSNLLQVLRRQWLRQSDDAVRHM